jgi:hypothetical protein
MSPKVAEVSTATKHAVAFSNAVFCKINPELNEPFD